MVIKLVYKVSRDCKIGKLWLEADYKKEQCRQKIMEYLKSFNITEWYTDEHRGLHKVIHPEKELHIRKYDAPIPHTRSIQDDANHVFKPNRKTKEGRDLVKLWTSFGDKDIQDFVNEAKQLLTYQYSNDPMFITARSGNRWYSPTLFTMKKKIYAFVPQSLDGDEPIFEPPSGVKQIDAIEFINKYRKWKKEK